MGKKSRPSINQPWSLWWVPVTVFVFAVVVTLVFVLLGLYYQFILDIQFPRPAWGGYCEAKQPFASVLEPANSWSAISYCFFSALVIGVLIEFKLIWVIQRVVTSVRYNIQSVTSYVSADLWVNFVLDTLSNLIYFGAPRGKLPTLIEGDGTEFIVDPSSSGMSSDDIELVATFARENTPRTSSVGSSSLHQMYSHSLPAEASPLANGSVRSARGNGSGSGFYQADDAASVRSNNSSLSATSGRRSRPRRPSESSSLAPQDLEPFPSLPVSNSVDPQQPRQRSRSALPNEAPKLVIPFNRQMLRGASSSRLNANIQFDDLTSSTLSAAQQMESSQRPRSNTGASVVLPSSAAGKPTGALPSTPTHVPTAASVAAAYADRLYIEIGDAGSTSRASPSLVFSNTERRSSRLSINSVRDLDNATPSSISSHNGSFESSSQQQQQQQQQAAGSQPPPARARKPSVVQRSNLFSIDEDDSEDMMSSSSSPQQPQQQPRHLRQTSSPTGRPTSPATAQRSQTPSDQQDGYGQRPRRPSTEDNGTSRNSAQFNSRASFSAITGTFRQSMSHLKDVLSVSAADFDPMSSIRMESPIPRVISPRSAFANNRTRAGVSSATFDPEAGAGSIRLSVDRRSRADSFTIQIDPAAGTSLHESTNTNRPPTPTEYSFTSSTNNGNGNGSSGNNNNSRTNVVRMDKGQLKVAQTDDLTEHAYSTQEQFYQVELRWSFRTSAWLSIVYSFIGIVLGVGSFLFHARFDTPSSYGDFAGMIALATFSLAYALARLPIPGRVGQWIEEKDLMVAATRLKLTEESAVATSTTDKVIFFLHRWTPFRSFHGVIFFVWLCLLNLVGWLIRVLSPTDYTQELFAVSFAIAIIIEISLTVRRYRTSTAESHTLSRNHIGLLVLACVLFGLAFGFWQLDWERSALCVPTSIFQGHAMWHFLTACAFYILFAFYFSESSAVYVPTVDNNAKIYDKYDMPFDMGSATLRREKTIRKDKTLQRETTLRRGNTIKPSPALIASRRPSTVHDNPILAGRRPSMVLDGIPATPPPRKQVSNATALKKANMPRPPSDPTMLV